MHATGVVQSHPSSRIVSAVKAMPFQQGLPFQGLKPKLSNLRPQQVALPLLPQKRPVTQQMPCSVEPRMIQDSSVQDATTTHAPSSLKFAKHLANVSNGCAPPMSRFESLGWLLFETKRLQATTIGPSAQAPDSWLCTAANTQLLEQIYLVGAAIAELGTADGLQPLSTSNGSRAIVSLDYSRLLERYLQQHGQLLTEEFWSGLCACDDLQARAIHVATALETRCMVHAMLFDKLIERVGTEGGPAAAWGSAAWLTNGGSSTGSTGPLATAISNTLINTTQQNSSPVTTQSTVSAPNTVNSNSNTANQAVAPPAGGGGGVTVQGILGWVGQLGAVFLLLCTVAGKVVQVVIAVVSFSKDLLMQLLMLRAVAAGAKAVAAKAGSRANPALQPAAAAAVVSLPAASAAFQAQQQQQQLPAEAVATRPVSAAALGAAGSAAATPAVSAGSLGLLAAVPMARHTAQPQQQQQQVQLSPLQPQQQHQEQWRLEARAVHLSAAWPPAAAQQAHNQQQQQQPASVGVQQQQLRTALPQQLLSSGLSTAQKLLHTAAGNVGAAAAALPGVLQQQQQQQGTRTSAVNAAQRRPYRAGSGHLLYSLWSPADAGLQEMEEIDAAAAAGVKYADAGWGLDVSSTHNTSAGIAGRSLEHGW